MTNEETKQPKGENRLEWPKRIWIQFEYPRSGRYTVLEPGVVPSNGAVYVLTGEHIRLANLKSEELLREARAAAFEGAAKHCEDRYHVSDRMIKELRDLAASARKGEPT